MIISFLQKLFCAIFALLLSSTCHAMNWGHLLTGTTDVLKKDHGTAGTLLFAGGVTEKTTMGFSPFAYMVYNFSNLILREGLYQGENYSSALDFIIFDSLKDHHSYYEQTSWTARLNNKLKFTNDFSIYGSLGLQYFINEKSPYSFRPDPLGRYRSFMPKYYDYYEKRLADFEQYHRDPKTISLSVMPEVFLNEDFFLNLEYGILGVNYVYPLQHFGGSLNYQYSSFDIGMGVTRSTRKTPMIGTETIDHTEGKLQFYF